MSAPAAVPVPQGPGGKPAAPISPRTPALRWIILALVPLAALGWWFGTRHTTPVHHVVIHTAKAFRAPLAQSRRLTGNVIAERFASIQAPIQSAGEPARGNMILIEMAANGARVKKGDLIGRIDAQATEEHLDDVESDLLQTEYDIRRRQATQAAEMEAQQQRVRTALATYQRAQEDYRAVETKTAINQELMRLQLEEAKAVYEQLAGDIDLLAERQQCDLNIVLLQQQRLMRHRDRHRVDVARFKILAPMDGMIVLQTVSQRGEQRQIQVGEELSPGQPIMRVVDPSSMMLDSNINQTESDLVRLGQRADIRFDAFPDITVRGKIISIGAMTATSRRVNYYIRRIPVRVAFLEQNPRVIPDLSASADVITAEQAPKVVIPREAVKHSGSKSVVYVKKPAGDFEPREVQVGASNTTHTMILAGLSDGEEVSLTAID